MISPIWNWVQKVMGWDNGKEKKKDVAGKENCGDCCAMVEDEDGEETNSKVKTKSTAAAAASSSSKNTKQNSKNSVSIPESPFYLDDSMDDFEDILNGADVPVIVKFTATWCKPCKAVEPCFNALAEEYRNSAHFVSVDIDEFDSVAEKYWVKAIPRFIVFRDGCTKVDELFGSDEKKLTKLVRDACCA